MADAVSKSKSLVECGSINWNEISESFCGKRSPMQCENRWNVLIHILNSTPYSDQTSSTQMKDETNHSSSNHAKMIGIGMKGVDTSLSSSSSSLRFNYGPVTQKRNINQTYLSDESTEPTEHAEQKSQQLPHVLLPMISSKHASMISLSRGGTSMYEVDFDQSYNYRTSSPSYPPPALYKQNYNPASLLK